MTVNAISDTKKGEQGLRLLIFILPTMATNRKSYMGYRTAPFSIEPHLEGHQTQISRSGHSLTLNISKMATDMVIVTTNGTTFNDLE